MAVLWQHMWTSHDVLINRGWTFTMRKVKAHCTIEHVNQGKITHFEYLGNNIADYWAGKGAKFNELEEHVAGIVDQMDGTAWLVQSRLLTVCINFIEKGPRAGPKIPVPKISKLDKMIYDLRHDVKATSSKLQICVNCCQSWYLKDTTYIAELGPCPGDMVWGPPSPNRPQLRKANQYCMHLGADIHRSHKAAWYRGVLYCTQCGTMAIKQVPKKLKESCLLKPGSTQCASKLKSIKSGNFPGPSGWPLPEGSSITEVDRLFQ